MEKLKRSRMVFVVGAAGTIGVVIGATFSAAAPVTLQPEMVCFSRVDVGLEDGGITRRTAVKSIFCALEKDGAVRGDTCQPVVGEAPADVLGKAVKLARLGDAGTVEQWRAQWGAEHLR